MEAPKPIASAGFWSEREEEFRKYGTGEYGSVEALWSLRGSWQFLDGLHGDDGVASTRCTQVFESLAREAWKGFSGHQSGESWIDWLDAHAARRLRRTHNIFSGCAYRKSDPDEQRFEGDNTRGMDVSVCPEIERLDNC